MNTRIIAAALVAGALLLAGCEASGQNSSATGCSEGGMTFLQPAGCRGQAATPERVADTDTPEQGCESHGWGPLSDCDEADDEDGPGWRDDPIFGYPPSCPPNTSGDLAIDYEHLTVSRVDTDGTETQLPTSAQCRADLQWHNGQFNTEFRDEMDRHLGGGS